MTCMPIIICIPHFPTTSHPDSSQWCPNSMKGFHFSHPNVCFLFQKQETDSYTHRIRRMKVEHCSISRSLQYFPNPGISKHLCWSPIFFFLINQVWVWKEGWVMLSEEKASFVISESLAERERTVYEGDSINITKEKCWVLNYKR